MAKVRQAPASLLPTESEEQIALFQWAEWYTGQYPELEYLYHIPNGGLRNKATAGRLKAEGVKSGVPDVCLPVKNREHSGLYIEMKRRIGGKTSEKQKRWLEFLASQGYLTAVCNGWQEAAALILRYLRGI